MSKEVEALAALFETARERARRQGPYSDSVPVTIGDVAAAISHLTPVTGEIKGNFFPFATWPIDASMGFTESGERASGDTPSCCEKFNTCTKPCVPLTNYWQGRPRKAESENRERQQFDTLPKITLQEALKKIEACQCGKSEHHFPIVAVLRKAILKEQWAEWAFKYRVTLNFALQDRETPTARFALKTMPRMWSEE